MCFGEALKEKPLPVMLTRRGFFMTNLTKVWQEWRGSNPQPPVLETGALPIELHS